MSKELAKTFISPALLRNITVSQTLASVGLLAFGIIPYACLAVLLVTLVVWGGAHVQGQLKRSSEEKELASYSNWVEEPKYLSEYDCKNYDQTSFDLKMADEGVISILDVATCPDGGRMRDCCPLCMPILKRQKEERERVQNEERAKRELEHKKMMAEVHARRSKRATDNDEKQLSEMSPADAKRVHAEQQFWLDKNDPWDKGIVNCVNHSEIETWFNKYCPACTLARLKQRDENDRLAKIAADKAAKAAARAEKERLFQERRKVNVMGVQTLRPLAVPEGAVPSILHGRDLDRFATHSYIVWKWTEDGQDTKFYKQPIGIDAYSVTGDTGVIETFFAVHDPDTGEHLGDYSTVNGHVSQDDLNKRIDDIEKWAWNGNKPERLK